MFHHDTVERVGVSARPSSASSMAWASSTIHFLHDVCRLVGIEVGVVKVGKQVVAVVLVPSAWVLDSAGKRTNLLLVVRDSSTLQSKLPNTQVVSFTMAITLLLLMFFCCLSQTPPDCQSSGRPLAAPSADMLVPVVPWST